MDKNQQEVLNGLIHSIEDLKERLLALEAQVTAFAASAAAEPAPLSYRAEQSEASVSPAPSPIPDDTPMDWSDTEIGVVEIPEQVRNDDVVVQNDVQKPMPEPVSEPVEEPVAEPAPLSYRAEQSEASVSPEPEPVAEPVEAPAEAPAPVKGKSLADLAAERLAWKSDFPGISVKNIRSAISLIDRAQFIAKLFNEDFALYDKTISELNELTTLDEAVQYVTGHFPDWNLSSDIVYSFMMAIRKKLG
ncbi:MAG: hypothetical protein IKX37_04245 [Bacteroidales bacterium]|nr:hypothetical protein [Bacteroidales bacterium]